MDCAGQTLCALGIGDSDCELCCRYTAQVEENHNISPLAHVNIIMYR